MEALLQIHKKAPPDSDPKRPHAPAGTFDTQKYINGHRGLT
nr:MAG TPA: hypothetical protein [Caudoviricetes sp.]